MRFLTYDFKLSFLLEIKMSLKEFIRSEIRNKPTNVICARRRKLRKYRQLFLALIIFSSVVGGHKGDLLKILRINVLVGASIASKYKHFICYQ